MLPPTVGADYDALLVLSFGGPERPEDVMPFLENVTRGRGIPPERLAEVAEHYYAVGGRSPINALNRALVAAIESDLKHHGIDLPVYWGNRNWEPYLDAVIDQMAADGVRHAAVFTTSAYSSYSSCRQYREDLYAATDGTPVRVTRLPRYAEHWGFVDPFIDGTKAALGELGPDAHVAFVTHSIPDVMNEASGGPGVGAYVRQHEEVAATVAVGAGANNWTLSYCSRSGPPQMPWLEPDINDHLAELHADGCRAVVVVPIGFVSDHMEVAHDLDVEAKETAEQLGMEFRRVSTPGASPDFVAMVRDLLTSETALTCAVDCCVNARSDKPVVA